MVVGSVVCCIKFKVTTSIWLSSLTSNLPWPPVKSPDILSDSSSMTSVFPILLSQNLHFSIFPDIFSRIFADLRLPEKKVLDKKIDDDITIKGSHLPFRGTLNENFPNIMFVSIINGKNPIMNWPWGVRFPFRLSLLLAI